MLTQELLKQWLEYNPETGDFIWLKRPSFRAVIGEIAGRTDNLGYKSLGLLGRQYRQHRLAFLYMTGKWPEDQVDHINGIRSDNRWENLREATNQQNGWNKQYTKRSKTGVKGVFPSGDKFQVQIRYKGKARYCGTYETLELAQEVAELIQEMVQEEFKYGSVSIS